MRIIFNNKTYEKNRRNGRALKNLCFDIFKQYLELNNNMNYSDIQDIFNQWHCNNNFVVLSYEDWQEKTENLRGRYFEPINYNDLKLYFSTQWGNNGGDCDNINNMIDFAKNEKYDIEVLELQSSSNDNEQSEEKSNNSIRNIILYGSPGVGKTHNTNKLISLIESGISEKKIFETIKNNEENDGVNIDDIKDRVKFVTFHQSFGYEDFIEGFRPNEEGKINLVDGVFKHTCKEAQKNLNDSDKSNVKIDNIDLDRLIEQFTNNIQDSLDQEKEFYLDKKVLIESINEQGSFLLGGSIKTNTQGLTIDILKRDYEAYKRGEIRSYQDIKPTYDSQRTFHGNARYYFLLLKKLYEFEQTLEHHAIALTNIERKNYYLVIDEINRGNISKIFGELITLIEEDKRDTFEVTLPYSKKPFKIPSNLYIIGTMNSTDKSIALIDIALRRRFTFLKMKPNIDLVDNVKAKNIMKQLNEKIIETLGADYVLGHSYFMKIENDDDLDFVLEYKIKPLLEEYFYGDTQGLEEILQICKLGVENIENNSETNE